MTEAEWMASDDPMAMSSKLKGELSRRVGSLLGVACVRATLQAQQQEFLVQTANLVERVAEGQGDWSEVDAQNALASQQCHQVELDSIPHFWALSALRLTTDNIMRYWMHVPFFLTNAVGGSEAVPELRIQYANFVRDVAGNPFQGGRGKRTRRPTKSHRFPVLRVDWCTTTVLSVAQGIYTERAFDGMPVLADALEEAGCDDTRILAHCREQTTHIRGCWVLDLVLNKT